MAEIGKKQLKIQRLISEITEVIKRLDHYEAKYTEELSRIHPKFVQSARNLIHFRALRKEDSRG
ncbi:MAG: hypothetical protein HKN52_12475, partial [Eudoraea sp.]|nr:hypothetical protein [Eudoraea sp.]